MKFFYVFSIAMLFCIAFAYGQSNVTTTTGGTANQMPKFTNGTNLENSQITDDGTNVGIGTIFPNHKLDVGGTVNATNFLLNGSPLPFLPLSGGTMTGDLTLGSAGFGSSRKLKGGSSSFLALDFFGFSNFVALLQDPLAQSGQVIAMVPPNAAPFATPNFPQGGVAIYDRNSFGTVGMATGVINDITNKQHIVLIGDPSRPTIGETIDIQNYTGDHLSLNGITNPSAWNVPMGLNISGGNVGIGTSPSEKLSVAGTIQSTTGGFKFPDGTIQTSAAAQTPLALAWEINGNPAINDATDFLGTTDAADLVFRTNNIERMRINKTNGRVGIGTTTPQTKLHIFESDNPLCSTTMRLEYLSTASTNGCHPGFYIWDITATGDHGNSLVFSTPSVSTAVMSMINRNGTGVVGIGDPFPGLNYEVPTGRLKFDVRGDGRFTSITNDANYVRLGYNGLNAIMDNFGAGSLLINYYSNKDVVIGSGTSILTANNGIISTTNHNTNNLYNLKISVNRNLTKAISVINGSAENFLVYGDGFCFARRFEVATGIFAHPDYVFKKEYPLLTVEQLKEFIDKEGHHPNFLSAKQYEKKGKYDLLEMDMNLLKTSEELTLYVVQQHNEIGELKQMINAQNEKITQMKLEIEKFKK